MSLVLRLNRGTYGTLNLNDGTTYCVLDTYLPALAPRKRSQFSGEPFETVVENIPLRVKGSTAALTLEAVENLVLALEQAYAWRMGAEIDPVLLEYLPEGTGLAAVLQACVLGTPDNTANLLELAQLGMYMVGKSFETALNVPLVRRGLWLGAAETPAASSAVANPGAMTITFASEAKLPAPCKLVFDDPSATWVAFAGTHQGFVLVADTDDKIVKVEAPTSGGTVGSWDSVTDANASGGSYEEIDLGDGPEANGQGTFTINEDARLFAVFASVFNQSTTYSYTLKARVGGVGFWSQWTKPISLGVSTGSTPNVYPRIEFLGFVATPGPASRLEIYVDGGAATGGSSDALALDYFIVQAVDDYTLAMAFDNGSNTTYQRTTNLTVDHRLLTAPTPEITYDVTSVGTIRFAYWSGSLYPYQIGEELTAWVIGTDPVNQGWRLKSSAGVLSFALTGTRRKGYVVPR